MEEVKINILKKPVEHIKGVGKSRAALLNKLGIFTIEDLITYYPRNYEDRSQIKKISELEDGEMTGFKGVIASTVVESRPRRGLTIQKVLIKEENTSITAVWFNQSFLKNVFRIGEKYIFFGKISRNYSAITVQNPVYEKLNNGSMEKVCRIVPVYPTTAKLTQNVLRSIIKEAIEVAANELIDPIPEWIRGKNNLCHIQYAVQNIHFPKSDEDFKHARYRLVFEELLRLQLGLYYIKNKLNTGKGIEFSKDVDIESFCGSLPFKLTNSQKKVLNEVITDMESPKVMNRLIQGDVGSGKTVIATVALYKASKSGYQGALLVPTEILAEQHYKSINGLLSQSGISTALLTGSTGKKEKAEILNRIENGELDVVIGTHALLEDRVNFNNLGLVITDEQHRFGVRQRAVLSQKGKNPDVLVMTATPIPRTLALILYGDMDISIIDELPPGRMPVKTYVVDDSMKDRVNSFIRKNVLEGRQIYIVCPLVEESEVIEGTSAVQLAERLSAKEFSGLKVGLVHGKMKPEEKELVMRNFVEGNINILVSTTVIEVGVNVPNATIMVIENAERFGLAQLHQLRGRVGRGNYQSYCILYNRSKASVALERMRIMQKTTDGFLISEKDLKLRGPGEFMGTRQHGLPDLKIANLYKDLDILKKVQEAAGEIIRKDPALKGINSYLKNSIIDK